MTIQLKDFPDVNQAPKSAYYLDNHLYRDLTVDNPELPPWDFSTGMFKGYDGSKDPWDMPMDFFLHYTIVYDKKEQLWIYSSPSTPLVDYVMYFKDLVPTADDQGKHMGQHPVKTTKDGESYAAAAKIPSAEIKAWMPELKIVENQSTYPLPGDWGQDWSGTIDAIEKQ